MTNMQNEGESKKSSSWLKNHVKIDFVRGITKSSQTNQIIKQSNPTANVSSLSEEQPISTSKSSLQGIWMRKKFLGLSFKQHSVIASGFVVLLGSWFALSEVFQKVQVGSSTVYARSNKQQLASLLNNHVDAYRINVTYPDGKTKSYSTATIGVIHEDKGTIGSIDKQRNSIKKRLSWWKPIIPEYQFKEDEEKIKQFIAREIDVQVQPSQDASLSIENGKIKLTESVSGIYYSLENPESVLLQASRNMKPTTITLKKLTQDAKLSEKLLQPYKEQLEKTINQPITFVIGQKTIKPSSADIANWLEITPKTDKSNINITVNSGKVVEYINRLAANSIRPARNEMVVDKPDGTRLVITSGLQGMDIKNKGQAATTVANTLLDAKGMNIAMPVTYQPFQTVQAGYYGKWIEADVTNKRLYAHEYTSTIRTFLISAGAPATPTVTGQYTIGRKYISQDMSGSNIDGSNYFQPRVPYVNYFYQGYAIHGNYWRPASYFGNINSSHGCIGLMTEDSRWLYDWAPVGTPIIIYK